MKPMLRYAAYQIVHQKLTDVNWLPLLLTIIKKHKIGFFPHWYESIFFQTDSDESPFSLYEAYCFLCLHYDLGLGNIVYAEINLGEEPNSDDNNDAINHKLHKLWPPFKAIFWGGKKDEDGTLYVDDCIELSSITYENQARTKNVSGQFPLEVGTTDIFKTMVYLNSGINRVARWPYGSKKIYLLARY